MSSIQKRSNQNGEVNYRVQVRIKGYPNQSASFSRMTDAKKWAQDTESAIRQRRYFGHQEGHRRTVGEAIDKYENEVLSLRKNPANQKIYARWWRSQIGSYMLCDVSASLISECRSQILGTRNRFGRTIGATTVNRYVEMFNHMMNVAVREWEWIPSNPGQKVKKYKESRGRVRYLSEQERTDLIKACDVSKNKYLALIVVMAISTGARKDEILSLRRQYVDFERGQITFPQTKNEDRRTIPLQGYALKLLAQHFDSIPNECDLVFPRKKVSVDERGFKVYEQIDIRTAWENALLKSGVRDFRFHDLRHSAASYLAMSGASLPEISDVLGHKTLQMVKRYAHLSEAHTRGIVAKMNENIFGEKS